MVDVGNKPYFSEEFKELLLEKIETVLDIMGEDAKKIDFASDLSMMNYEKEAA